MKVCCISIWGIDYIFFCELHVTPLFGYMGSHWTNLESENMFMFACLKSSVFVSLWNFAIWQQRRRKFEVYKRLFWGKHCTKSTWFKEGKKINRICYIKKLLFCSPTCTQTIVLFSWEFLPKGLRKSRLAYHIKRKKFKKLGHHQKWPNCGWVIATTPPSLVNKEPTPP